MTHRIVAWLLAGCVLVAGLAIPAVAWAQLPAPVDRAPPGVKVKDPPRTATPAGKQVSRRDVITATTRPVAPNQKRSTGMAIAFWALAALAVAGALFVITRKNLIAAVMGMVGTFAALAALYMLLYAHFLAVIQMLVYAGAIMVLFVFVIMILNRPEDEPYPHSGLFGKALAGLAMLYLLFRLGSVLVAVDVNVTPAQTAAPAATAQGYDWGSTAAVGWNLFNEYLFPFEAVSILLLVAVVGAIAVARPLKDDEQLAEPAGDAGTG